MHLIKSAFVLLLSVASVSSADTNKNIIFTTTDIDAGAVTLTEPSWDIDADEVTPTDSSWDIDDADEVALTESGWRQKCRCDWGNRSNGCYDQRRKKPTNESCGNDDGGGGSNSCRQAERDAQREVDQLYDGKCARVVDGDFNKRVNRMQDRKFPANPRDFRERQRNECGRAVIKKELNRIGRSCNNDDGGDCRELGEYAAQNIVKEEVCSDDDDETFGTKDVKEFQRSCRSVAINYCRSGIQRAKNKECSEENINRTREQRLGNMCRSAVNKLIGKNDEEDKVVNTI